MTEVLEKLKQIHLEDKTEVTDMTTESAFNELCKFVLFINEDYDFNDILKVKDLFEKFDELMKSMNQILINSYLHPK